jgi:hypothetical protein
VVQQGISVVHGWIAAWVPARLWHLHVGLSCVLFLDVIGHINNNPELAFLHDKAQERYHEVGDEVQEWVKEAKAILFLLLLLKLLHCDVCIFVHDMVVII